MAELARVELSIQGRVQGVGYRWFARRRAEELGLVGWVRNRPDGTVTLLAQGSRGRLEELIDWCRIGPPASSVSHVAVLWAAAVEDPRPGFDIRG